MLYIERKPAFLLRPFVSSLWYGNAPFVAQRRERILPSGCAHIVVSLSRDFLTDCGEDRRDQRTAPALMVGQRSIYEIVATADFVDPAGVLFMPGAVAALIGDRADLISNRNLGLDQVWSGSTNYLRSRMIEGSSPEARLRILDNCLTVLLMNGCNARTWVPHSAVRFALQAFEQNPNGTVADIARRSGWSERRFSEIFREQVGFPPKVWSRLQRFHRAARRLRREVETPWAALAVECG